MEQGVRPLQPECPCCSKKLSWKRDPFRQEVISRNDDSVKKPSEVKECFIYRCPSRACNYQASVFKDSFFDSAKKPPQEILLALHLWIKRTPVGSTCALLCWSERAVISFYKRFRELVSLQLTLYLECVDDPIEVTYENCIGSPGKVIQVDESAFGKRKYNRGYHVETKWVFGGVEVTEDSTGSQRGGKFFTIVVPNRTRETLHAVIKQFISPGSLIVSDG